MRDVQDEDGGDDPPLISHPVYAWDPTPVLDRFDIECEDVLLFGDRAVAFIHIEVAARAGAPTITGDIAHVIEFEGNLVKRFIAYRDRAEAVAAAESDAK